MRIQQASSGAQSHDPLKVRVALASPSPSSPIQLESLRSSPFLPPKSSQSSNWRPHRRLGRFTPSAPLCAALLTPANAKASNNRAPELALSDILRKSARETSANFGPHIPLCVYLWPALSSLIGRAQKLSTVGSRGRDM